MAHAGPSRYTEIIFNSSEKRSQRLMADHDYPNAKENVYGIKRPGCERLSRAEGGGRLAILLSRSRLSNRELFFACWKSADTTGCRRPSRSSSRNGGFKRTISASAAPPIGRAIASSNLRGLRSIKTKTDKFYLAAFIQLIPELRGLLFGLLGTLFRDHHRPIGPTSLRAFCTPDTNSRCAVQ
jgi:hypothetical protein